MSQMRKIILLILFSMANMLFMHYYIFYHHYLEDIQLAYTVGINLMTVFFDVSVILLVYLLLSWGRLKLSILLTYVTTFVWSFVNVFYARFFSQYLPLSILSQTSQLTDQAVVNSMMAGFQWTDLYFVFFLFFFIVLYKALGVQTLDKQLFVKILLVPLLSFIGIFAIYSAYHFLKPDTRNNWELYKRRMGDLFTGSGRNSFPNQTRYQIGSVRVAIGEIYDMIHKIELTQEQRDSITAEFSDLSHRVTDHHVNSNIKNVIFVVLESFMSAPIDLKVDGMEITPFLNSLKHEEDTYYNGHVIPNITMGESGDGQFIFMTGLLPLRDKLTVGEAKGQNLPSFPRLLAKQYGTNYSEIVMPSPPQVWEQQQMNEVYGIKKMYCNWDVLGKVVDYLNDEQVFTLAMNSSFYKHQPFFSMVLSYSTHQPYRNMVDNSLSLNDPSLTDAYKNYLIACHYTDSWVKRYFTFLKQKGVYDNSLIIITADHHVHFDAIGMEGKMVKELPLYIINGNIDKGMVWTGKMNQLDIYTTLLDMLGIESDWHGLGHTILSPSYQNSLNEQAWSLSEQIIKGNYFGALKTE